MLYFVLKDEQSSIDVTMHESVFNRLDFKPEDGMEVFIEGKVSYFDRRGKLSFKSSAMEENGLGNLHKKFEQMKAKLKEEGLFEAHHKKKIPSYPKVIGVITSKTGAAVHDIINTIQRRYPIAQIEIYPVTVQGPTAAPSIVKAIQSFSRRNTSDVLIVGRGGGSIEDLWAFNEETVARAIFECHIPIISAVGHETDTTISDFVSDKSASTPTAAAEFATPLNLDILNGNIEKMTYTINQGIKRKLDYQRKNIERFQKNISDKHPKNKLSEMKFNKDNLIHRLSKSVDIKIERQKNQVQQLSSQIHYLSPNEKIKKLKSDVFNNKKILYNQMNTILKGTKGKFALSSLQLDGLSPLKTMSRGYSLPYKQGKLIKSVDSLSIDEKVTIKIQDGEFDASIQTITKKREEI
jgi:exodeoxyribonuclease VII large subunit